jgi:hypothetical protein
MNSEFQSSEIGGHEIGGHKDTKSKSGDTILNSWGEALK